MDIFSFTTAYVGESFINSSGSNNNPNSNNNHFHNFNISRNFSFFNNHDYHGLHKFHETFVQYYGYASVVVCSFGVILNVINISVLMTKEMRTPTNQFLVALAFFDILTMLPYIPFVLHFHCPPLEPFTNPEAFTHSWMFFLLVVINLVATTHFISIWMAVSLAAFRYIQIRRPCPRGPLTKERRIERVRIIIVGVTILSTLVLIPNYFAQKIQPQHSNNVTFYVTPDIQWGTEHTDPFVLVNYLIYSIVGKIIPCLLILLFSGHLIYHMSVKNIRRRQRLSAMAQQWKTTHMLLVVLVLFICTELPQGILIVMSATIPGFFNNTHYYLGDLLDFSSLLNNAINFILYCAMSQQFRDKFRVMYVNRFWHGGGSNPPAKSSHSEMLTMREGVPRTTTTTTHVLEDQKTANL